MAKRGGKRRDPAREKFWRRTIREQQRSGLAVRAFCLREGLKDWTFRWWRQELARRDREPSAAPRAEREVSRPNAAPVFLPVRVVDLEASRPGPRPRSRSCCRPARPSGSPPDSTPAPSVDVLAVLEGRPC